MHNTTKKYFSLITNALFYGGIWLLLTLVSTDALSKNKIDAAAVKKLQETIISIQFQLKESIDEISEIQQTLRPLRSNLKNHDKSIRKSIKNDKTINSTLESINQKLIDAYKRLDANKESITSNYSKIDNLDKEILTRAREIRANTSDIIAQKTLIEDNSIRLYEILIKSANLADKTKKLEQALKKIDKSDSKLELKNEIYISINQLWHLFSAVLVIFYPLAFVLSSRRNHFRLLANSDGVTQHQGITLVTLAVFLGYFALGFELMYGSTNSGWIGMPSYLVNEPQSSSILNPGILSSNFMLQQIGFSLLAAMIAYIAVGRQLSSLKHLFLALFIATIIIPIFGHWVWSGHFIADNKGWLETKGFIDQGGAIVANTLSAIFALFIVIKLGKSYFPTDIEKEGSHPIHPIYSSSSVFLLWLAWLGFTTGNLSIADEKIALVMLNIGLAGSTGGLTAYVHYRLFYSQNNGISQETSGFVAGLVAIAACAQSVTHLEAIAIGAGAGLLQNIGYYFLRKYFLPYQWQRKTSSLVAIHGIGGIWGGICVALFATDGDFSSPNLNQLTTQLIGIGSVIIYSFIMAKITLFFLQFRKKSQQTTS
jgi:Amt family ammonium transporter